MLSSWCWRLGLLRFRLCCLGFDRLRFWLLFFEVNLLWFRFSLILFNICNNPFVRRDKWRCVSAKLLLFHWLRISLNMIVSFIKVLITILICSRQLLLRLWLNYNFWFHYWCFFFVIRQIFFFINSSYYFFNAFSLKFMIVLFLNLIMMVIFFNFLLKLFNKFIIFLVVSPSFLMILLRAKKLMRLSIFIKVCSLLIVISSIFVKSLLIEVHTIWVVEASIWQDIKVEFIVIATWNFSEDIFMTFFTWSCSFFILLIFLLRNFLLFLRLLLVLWLSRCLLRQSHLLTLFLILRFFNNRAIRCAIFHLSRFYI